MSKKKLKSALVRYAVSSATNFSIGVSEIFGLSYGYHYKAKLHNSKRIVKLTLTGFPPSKFDEIKKQGAKLSHYTGLPQHDQIRILGGSNRQIIIEIPKPKKLYNNVYMDDLNYSPNPYDVPLGLDTGDKQINLNFSDPMTSHVLLAGQTRSGKTFSLKYILWSLCRDYSPDTGLVIFDVAKAADDNYKAFENHPNLIMPIIKTEEQAKIAFEKIISIRKSGNKHYKKIFVVVDELWNLFINDKENNSIEAITDLTSMGGQCGIHCILATQQPKVTNIKGVNIILDNLTTRLCGKVTNASNSQNALGLPDLGAERLTGYGEFIIASHDTPARFVFPLFSDNDLDQYEKRAFEPLESFSEGENNSFAIALSDSSSRKGEVTLNLDDLGIGKTGRPSKSYEPGQEASALLLVCNAILDSENKIGIKKLRATVKDDLGFYMSDNEIKNLKAISLDILRATWVKKGL